MTILRGAFDPAGNLDRLDIEHVFCRADDFAWATNVLNRIVGGGRAPLLTLEPFDGTPDGSAWRRWRGVLSGWGAVYVRYLHEMNGDWYPWASEPDWFQRAWADFAAAMPTNVRRVWSPNISYPGSGDLIRYWPHPDTVDVIGLDGYARNGETPAELFRPTLDEIADFFRGERKPVWICETAVPRGRTQGRYAEALVRFVERQGIAAVCWFNVRKEGPDEADWRMTKVAQRAFLEGR